MWYPTNLFLDDSKTRNHDHDHISTSLAYIKCKDTVTILSKLFVLYAQILQ